MYIDSSRIRLINKLQNDLRDVKIPMWQKKKAQRLITKVQKELKDKHLAEMRERLVRAVRADDKYETWKITCQIKDYMHEEIPHDIWVED